MTMPKKILILTADAGFGHRSAANAIAGGRSTSATATRASVDIVNPLARSDAPSLLTLEPRATTIAWCSARRNSTAWAIRPATATVAVSLIERSLIAMLLQAAA